jgi:N,N'-diacetyllegionaminate synthase
MFDNEEALITVSGRKIGPKYPTFIVAEIGINHGGDEQMAARLVVSAAEAGADAVKLQTVDADESYAPGTASYAEFKGKELSCDALIRLGKLAREKGVILFSTPGDFKSLDLMVEGGMPAVKISSGLLTNLPLIRAAAKTGLPLILSTGMAYLEEIEESVRVARQAGCNELAVLQCTSLYPAPPEKLNLRAIRYLAETLNVPVGYSDHHLGPLACLAAVCAGACIVEKHFTLDRSKLGADHAISAEPVELSEMVKQLRTVESMLGRKEKQPASEELRLREGRHRYLVARRAIAIGEKLSREIVALKRVPPGAHGIPANRYEEVMGNPVCCAIDANQVITDSMVGTRR